MKNVLTHQIACARSLSSRVTRGVLAAACVLLAAACDVHKVSEPGSLATLVVSPNTQTLAINATQQFTATGRDFAGVVIPVSPIWTVVAGGGAISSSGVFTAGTTPGTFTSTVKATSGNLSSTASITVTVGSLAAITITPSPDTTVVNGTKQFVAVGRDAAGNVVGMTPVWSIANGGGTINSTTGLFTAGTVAGTFANTIRVASGSISSTVTEVVVGGALASIVVAPSVTTVGVGATQQFVATAFDALGNALATPSIVWTVGNGGGTIGTATGLFTAGSALGTFANTVRATSGALSGTATVTVTAGPLATIVVTPTPVSLGVGGTQQFTAVGQDATGNVVAITPVWSVANGGGVINTTTGLFTAGTSTGTFANTVRATSGALSGSATVTVTATSGVLATIDVTPTPVTLGSGATQQFVATGRDAAGNVVTITPTWSVVASGGTIGASSGLFTAGVTPGTFTNTVRATSGTISGSATVTVTAGALATITVTPNPASVAANGTQQFVATGRDASGAIVVITPLWSVVNSGGTIGQTSGLFTAGATTGTYVNTVRATSGAVGGSATVTVTSAAPPPVVDLGTAAPNGIIAGTAVTCITGGIVNANVSVSPGNTISGFGPCVISGVQHLGNAVAAQAQIDLTTAYNTLAGLACPPANAIVANLGGTIKAAGVYCSASGVGVTGTLTLDGGGNPNATFVFQIGSALTTAGNIVLINGAQAKNVYWQVGSSATIGTASQWQGNILALTSITLVDNATLVGRALARNGAVTLGTNNIITLP